MMTGLAQGGILWDAMHARTHPIGIPFLIFYYFLYSLPLLLLLLLSGIMEEAYSIIYQLTLLVFHYLSSFILYFLLCLLSLLFGIMKETHLFVFFI
jgi:hypothetical protein